MSDVVTGLIAKANSLNKDFNPKTVVLDSKIHEYKEGEFRGWYIGSEDTKNSRGVLTFEDWNGDRYTVVFGKYPKKDLDELLVTKTKLAKTISAEKDMANKSAASSADLSLKSMKRLPLGESSYLQTKLLGDVSYPKASQHNAFVNEKKELVIPMNNFDYGDNCNYQYIKEEKRFFPQGALSGSYHIVGDLPESIGREKLIFVEGYATGLTAYKLFGCSVVVCFNASNLVKVVNIFRKKYPLALFCVVADNDMQRKENVGLEAGKTAAREGKCSLFYIDSEWFSVEDIYTHNPTDVNDLVMHLGWETAKKKCKLKWLKPEDVITSEFDGFVTANEIGIKFHYNDLLKMLKREHKFFTDERGSQIYLYDRGVYNRKPMEWLLTYSVNKFKESEAKQREEFKKLAACSSPRSLDFLNSSTENKVCFKNGVLDYETMKFMPHSPDYGFTSQLEFNYDSKETETPVWNKFLHDITLGDKDTQQVLEEYIGYCLSGDPIWAHKALILVGKGSNGKSTLIGVIRKLLGRANVTGIPVSALKDDRKVHLAFGKLAVLSEENSTYNMDCEVFKNFVSGGEMVARDVYASAYEFNNKAKTILSFNSFDHTRDLSNGFFRRLSIIKFNAHFDETMEGFDPFIDEKLEKELCGIFNKTLSVYKKAKANQKLLSTKSIIKASEDLKNESDSVMSFLIECGMYDSERKLFTSTNDAFVNEKNKEGQSLRSYIDLDRFMIFYNEWCDENNKIRRERRFVKRILVDLLEDSQMLESTDMIIKRGGKCQRVLSLVPEKLKEVGVNANTGT